MALQRMKDVTVERGIVYGSEAVLAKQVLTHHSITCVYNANTLT